VFGQRPAFERKAGDGLDQQRLGLGEPSSVAKGKRAGGVADVMLRHRITDFPPALDRAAEIAAAISEPAALDREPRIVRKPVGALCK
jgi:hypothetical protein